MRCGGHGSHTPPRRQGVGLLDYRLPLNVAHVEGALFSIGECDHHAEQFVALRVAGVVVTPGVGFGPSGEGFFRIALTLSTDRLAEGMERLQKLRW